MVDEGGSSGKGSNRLLEEFSLRSTALPTQSPAQARRGSSSGPNGTGATVGAGRTAADELGKFLAERELERKEREREREKREKKIKELGLFPNRFLTQSNKNPTPK
ncbi:hypothetical protein ACLB2K_016795 [Fragaria x ananassa]